MGPRYSQAPTRPSYVFDAASNLSNKSWIDLEVWIYIAKQTLFRQIYNGVG